LCERRRGLRGGGCEEWVSQERLGPSYFSYPLVLGPLNSLNAEGYGIVAAPVHAPSLALPFFSP
jgi:hypothetical protein